MVASPLAHAQDDDVDANEVTRYEIVREFLQPQEVFSRTQAVLTHFGVPSEQDPQSEVNALSGKESEPQLAALIPYFDPDREFGNYATLSGSRVSFFQDRQGFEVPDFSATLSSGAGTTDDAPNPLAVRLAEARSNPAAQPLLGLKIALDPGHMGGTYWDGITGKWIRDEQSGRYLSEGVINLQTAILLKDSLTQLGAQVMLTHKGLRPVTDVDYTSFDLGPSALRALRESTLLSWFQELVDQNPIGQALFDSFSESVDYEDLYAEHNRWDDYNAIDLQARVDAIDAFHPDITLIIHYDVSVSDENPHGLSPAPAGQVDATKVYVAGAFAATELSSRDDRAQFAMHLLDQSTWNISVAFARTVASTLNQELGIPFDQSSPGLTREVAPGVFSRNLYLLRKYQISATAYAEGLFYNDPGEFDAFSNATHPMTIDGKNYPYSDRLAQVASAYRDAIVKFVQGTPDHGPIGPR